MPDTIIETSTNTPKRFQCRHIFTDGHRYGSACLRNEEFCYYHHTTRRPVASPKQRRSRRATFHPRLPTQRNRNPPAESPRSQAKPTARIATFIVHCYPFSTDAL